MSQMDRKAELFVDGLSLMERLQSMNIEIEQDLTDASTDTLDDIGKRYAKLSFTTFMRALHSMAKALESFPRVFMFRVVGFELSNFYDDLTSRTRSEDDTADARNSLILLVRQLVIDATPYAEIVDRREKRQLQDSIAASAGATYHVTYQGLRREVNKQIEAKSAEYAEQEGDEGNDEQEAAHD